MYDSRYSLGKIYEYYWHISIIFIECITCSFPLHYVSIYFITDLTWKIFFYFITNLTWKLGGLKVRRRVTSKVEDYKEILDFVPMFLSIILVDKSSLFIFFKYVNIVNSFVVFQRFYVWNSMINEAFLFWRVLLNRIHPQREGWTFSLGTYLDEGFSCE